MALEIKIPSPGESITEVQIATWLKQEGEFVKKNEDILEIESEKATLTIPSEGDGILNILVPEGETINVGDVAGKIEESTNSKGEESGNNNEKIEPSTNTSQQTSNLIYVKVPSPGESITEVQIATWLKQDGEQVQKNEDIAEIESEKATLALTAETTGTLKILVSEGETVAVDTIVAEITPNQTITSDSLPLNTELSTSESEKTSYASGHPSVAAQKMMNEKEISNNQIQGTGKEGRITKSDVLNFEKTSPTINSNSTTNTTIKEQTTPSFRNQERSKMSPLRKKIAERLVSVKNETAMLTTFNEVDLGKIMLARKKYKETFKEKYNIGLGFMSFFTKAVTMALQEFPSVNSMIDGNEMISHNYVDMGIAVSAPKGLVVPVIRNAESLSLAEIEKSIKQLATKARDNKITIDEMTGGTFTITNGGVFGSMLSTPILNPPQSAILGMHNIVDRPVAIQGEVVIRPIMYVALSYDHRIIDGRESVSFLVRVKQLLEDPIRMLLEV